MTPAPNPEAGVPDPANQGARYGLGRGAQGWCRDVPGPAARPPGKGGRETVIAISGSYGGLKGSF
jgi:hypothetical protein